MKTSPPYSVRQSTDDVGALVERYGIARFKYHTWEGPPQPNGSSSHSSSVAPPSPPKPPPQVSPSPTPPQPLTQRPVQPAAKMPPPNQQASQQGSPAGQAHTVIAAPSPSPTPSRPPAAAEVVPPKAPSSTGAQKAPLFSVQSPLPQNGMLPTGAKPSYPALPPLPPPPGGLETSLSTATRSATAALLPTPTRLPRMPAAPSVPWDPPEDLLGRELPLLQGMRDVSPWVSALLARSFDRFEPSIAQVAQSHEAALLPPLEPYEEVSGSHGGGAFPPASSAAPGVGFNLERGTSRAEPDEKPAHALSMAPPPEEVEPNFSPGWLQTPRPPISRDAAARLEQTDRPPSGSVATSTLTGVGAHPGGAGSAHTAGQAPAPSIYSPSAMPQPGGPPAGTGHGSGQALSAPRLPPLPPPPATLRGPAVVAEPAATKTTSSSARSTQSLSPPAIPQTIRVVSVQAGPVNGAASSGPVHSSGVGSGLPSTPTLPPVQGGFPGGSSTLLVRDDLAPPSEGSAPKRGLETGRAPQAPPVASTVTVRDALRLLALKG